MENRFTRRDFSFAAITAASAGRAPARSAMNPQNVNTNAAELDPVAWTKREYESAPLKLTFRATNLSEAQTWQTELRAKLTDLLGGFPEQRSLQSQTIDFRRFPSYTREKFVFESRPGVEVLGYLLLPNAAPQPSPAVICIPGHGRGVDDIVGIDAEGKDRTKKEGYQYDFAIQVVEHGLAAVAIEPMAFGYRRDPLTIAKGAKETACQPAAGSALLFGQTMLGWRVWDVMRTIDWIGTRKELDNTRIGCMGISGGGTCTQFTAALDTRIKAAFISGYLNTFRDSIMSVSHCIDNYVPGILNWAESYDVAGLIAPRFLFSEGGTRDPIFPVHATTESFQRVSKVYEIFGSPAHAQQEIFEGEHEFHGVKGLPFLVDALRG